MRILPAAATSGIAAGVLTAVIPLAIWPGEAELTAPLLCASHTDPMVVSDTWHDSEGTSVNYTLYCVGPRGEFTDEGFAVPMLILFAAHAVVVATLVILGSLLSRARPEPVTDRL
ncbi:hypothetical protein [Nocardia yamanashiensis]|uniref:hypothetical protein n=1 Tax=Nocardia yamanashiensis TaxID=209247 RepID=UPI0008325CF1|nr:hypothetical protein [Nocardia yamanashiensis]